MSKPGPKPRLKSFDPVSLAGRPRKPEGLDDAASLAWDELVSVLEERGTLTPGDGIALEMLTKILVNWRENFSAAVDAGPTTESGHVPGFKESPESQALGRSTKALLTLLIEFGMTPRSRYDVRPGAGTPIAGPLGGGYASWMPHLRKKTP